LPAVHAFHAPDAFTRTRTPSTCLRSADDDYAPSDCDDHSDVLSATPPPPEAAALKARLLTLCAAYDRGYGVTPSARRRVDDLVAELTEINPTMDAARGIDGDGNNAVGDNANDIPLRGIWRMVWTTAVDVLNLGANPVVAPAAIYQDISDPPTAVNIIDLVPRLQSLLPGLPATVFRAEVTTTASSRVNMPGRVGLVFNSVRIRPVQVLGLQASDAPFPVPPIGIDLPKLPASIAGDGSSGPGFFDVLYLDGDLLIYKQNDPGGYFVLTKVDDCDP
jgi:hypothetical protein